MKMNTSGKYTSMVDFLQSRLRAFVVFYMCSSCDSVPSLSMPSKFGSHSCVGMSEEPARMRPSIFSASSAPAGTLHSARCSHAVDLCLLHYHGFKAEHETASDCPGRSPFWRQWRGLRSGRKRFRPLHGTETKNISKSDLQTERETTRGTSQCRKAFEVA